MRGLWTLFKLKSWNYIKWRRAYWMKQGFSLIQVENLPMLKVCFANKWIGLLPSCQHRKSQIDKTRRCKTTYLRWLGPRRKWAKQNWNLLGNIYFKEWHPFLHQNRKKKKRMIKRVLRRNFLWFSFMPCYGKTIIGVVIFWYQLSKSNMECVWM